MTVVKVVTVVTVMTVVTVLTVVKVVTVVTVVREKMLSLFYTPKIVTKVKKSNCDKTEKLKLG